MLSTEWIDKTASSTLRLTLNGRIIYAAYVGGSRVSACSLRGHILMNINHGFIKIAHWVVFESIEDETIQIAPVYDDLVGEILRDPSMFEQPVDIRSVYDMLSL